MHGSRGRVAWLGLVAGALWASEGRVAGQGVPEANRCDDPRSCVSTAKVRELQVERRVALDSVTPALRERVRKVLEQPTLFANGPVEIFPGRLALYEWLLCHPDQAASAWRRLGAPCSEITDRGKGIFGWTDGQGSDVTWQCVLTTERQRVWFAEGKVRPALLMPLVPVQAVVVLRYAEGKDRIGRPVIRHQAEVFFQTDSKTAAVVTRMLGASAPHVAEQCLAQLEMFFSALVWYCEQHPERTEAILGQAAKKGTGTAGG